MMVHKQSILTVGGAAFLFLISGPPLFAGVGVLAPTEDGRPVLHMHAALGRSGQTVTGCLREGVTAWVLGEVILYEILDADAVRVKDARTGLALLEPGTRAKG